jgi:hypothetical protein
VRKRCGVPDGREERSNKCIACVSMLKANQSIAMFVDMKSEVERALSME